ncbi:hypothetical protein CSA56_18775 [candidate division KSB3 bacterium]|uniref:Cysteine-rich domain-containing protein n=1 Tax=candidate division KSB3 bacterium TaxID=2044937 RepID=A0A2G6K7A3_9BACT|nr:MAG: hypothetical protein CSA56_18775 [candidate division KSB3 bacterium]
MVDALSRQFHAERQRILAICTRCGVCADRCEILPHTPLGDIGPHIIQQEAFQFLQTGEEGANVFTRTWSCMQCFGCVNDICPQGLNPMHFIELLREKYVQQGKPAIPESDPHSPDALQRVMTSIQTTETEFQQVFTPTPVRQSKYVFFPGCNVYFQPEKILTALDILALISNEIAFVPGLDFCCGNGDMYTGSIEKASLRSAALLEKLYAYEPEEVILWCPTCHCRFETTLSQSEPLPFHVKSFAQFVVEHLESLPLQERRPPINVTLHEACKSAFLGIDLTGPRQILQQLPGITLCEMPRHGMNTSCCGSGAIDCAPESFKRVRDERLQEASQTAPDMLVDVCHYCHDVFSREADRYPYEVVNFVTLLGKALGLAREDRFQKYIQWGDEERIWQDVEVFAQDSPYSKELIKDAIRQMFVTTEHV